MNQPLTIEPGALDADDVWSGEVAIIDYGICNVGSVRNMLRRAGFLATCIDNPAELHRFDRMILPGIGYFKTGMENLRAGGWIDPILRFAREDGKPVLGICLGMQLLARHSEEGDCSGLGLLDMEVRKFDRSRIGQTLPIPHMGWSLVDPTAHPLAHNAHSETQRFYFVHSLHAVAEPGAVEPIFWCTYGYPFLAACGAGNILGVQFHPEKSHLFGAQLLRNFMRI